MSGVVRSTALRAGGACVRCRKGKTKCVYENGRAPCKNCAKGMHECYLPSESVSHHHGQSPARHAGAHRPTRDSLPAPGAGASEARQPVVGAGGSRQQHPVVAEKLTPELIAECERVVTKTFPACVAFHKPSFVQQLKNTTLDPALVCGLLTCASRSSPTLIRRYGTATVAAETYAAKAIALINQNIDHPNLDEIQALCLVIIHEWGTRNAVRAYIYLGQAARMLQMYRILNSHHAAETSDPFLRDESFRRTLWLLYILDCMLTSTPGRFPALTPQDTVDVALPCSDLNFAFGNAVTVKTLMQHFNHAPVSPSHTPMGDIGEYGYIVLAATIWRDVVGMLATTNLHTFREEECADLISKIERLRSSLPMQLIDKPNQIELHMTMDTGYTFAMLHCLLHCATIFVHRRRLLQEVTARNFSLENFRMSSHCHELIDRLFSSSHGVIVLLDAVENGTIKDNISCLPIVMLFSAFTASATIAYLSLKGLTPPTAVETAAHIVKDGLRFMHDGTETWPLMGSWLRHLSVMQRVLNADGSLPSSNGAGRQSSNSHTHIGSVKDEVASNADTNPDVAMDYDQHSNSGMSGHHLPPPPPPRSVSDAGRDGSEPPTAVIPRRPGITTINGNAATAGGVSSSTSPPAAHGNHLGVASSEASKQSPDATSANIAPVHDGPATQDMTAPELCAAFERQLLDLDDLAAFMGGGV